GSVPGGAPLFYQKHMSHHMIELMPTDWFSQVTHGFLIRHPRRVTASYAAKRAEVTLADLGFERLVEIFDQVCDASGLAPPVLDSDATPMRAEGYLRALCAAWDIPFVPQMLSWPSGRRDSDGVWGQHWYGQVWQSTGFKAAPPKEVTLTAEQEKVAEAAMPFYERIMPHVLEPL
ncbi:MAG: HAD family hydrolase, partial [Pseudomonadota bacterium]